jgi:hypothetical protein
MTEEEWLTCTDPQRMADFCQDQMSARKARLFAVACCRHIAAQLADDRLRAAIAVAERHADNLTKRGELRAAQTQVDAALAGLNGLDRVRNVAVQLAVALSPSVSRVVSQAMTLKGVTISLFYDEKTRLFRELLGNPFCPVALDPAWLAWNDGVIPRLSRALYDDSAFERLPILADALEEAGCTDAVILDHCRSSGPHVRGCWVVDLLLGNQ